MKKTVKSAGRSSQKASGAVASHNSAVFRVELVVRINDGLTREARTIRLDASTASGGGVGKKRTISQADREKKARRICRASPPQRVADLMAVLSHPQRVILLGKLLEGEATHKLLGRQTGLKAGPLYHHLRELRSAGLIGPKVRDLYVITRIGKRAFLAALAFERLCRGA